MWSASRYLATMVPRPYLRAALLVVAGTFAGLAEAAVVVIVVGVAVGVASGDEMPSSAVETLDLATGTQLWIALGLAVGIMFVHVGIALLGAGIYADVLHGARARAIEVFTGATWDRQEREREGSLQETVTTLASNTAQLAGALVAGIVSLLALITVVVAALVVDPVATIVVVAIGGALVVVLRPLTRITRRSARHFVSANSRFAEDVSRMSSLAMELRVFGASGSAAAELEATSRTTAQIGRRLRFVQRLSWMLYRDVAVLFLVIAVSILYVLSDDVLLGAGTVVVLVVRAMGAAQAVQRSAQSIHELSPNVAATRERLEMLALSRSTDGTEDLIELRSIVFEGVSYEYEPGDGALRDVSLRIDAGDVVGVVGPSGGGKSTLIQVLLRLRLPDAGCVLVNDRPAQRIREDRWSQVVSLVPQEPRLMEATVAENVRFMRGWISDEMVERCLREAHLYDELIALPSGIDTELGPRGVGLSGGQKQRLAIARALAGSPQLIVLDEPTSALDVRSEQLLRETIEELAASVTLVIIAHRLSTLSVCRRLVVLRDGSIEREGSPAELASEPGFYRTMVDTLVDVPGGPAHIDTLGQGS